MTAFQDDPKVPVNQKQMLADSLMLLRPDIINIDKKLERKNAEKRKALLKKISIAGLVLGAVALVVVAVNRNKAA